VEGSRTASSPADSVVSWRLIVRPKAEADLAEAARWYEARRLTLGGQFLDEINRTLVALAACPERRPVHYRGFRRSDTPVPLQTFLPY
jgi:hypothetical protein